MNKAIFSDRDGVITKLINRKEKETSPWFPEEISYYNNVSESVRIAHDLGYKFFIVSNQPDLTPYLNGTALRINLFLLQDCKVDDIEISTIRGCHNYKPNPGLIEILQKKYDINLDESWMIGDTWKDGVCARLAGVKNYIHIRGKNPVIVPDYYANSLYDAMEFIKFLMEKKIETN